MKQPQNIKRRPWETNAIQGNAMHYVRPFLNFVEVAKRIEAAHNARGIFYHINEDGSVTVEKRDDEHE